MLDSLYGNLLVSPTVAGAPAASAPASGPSPAARPAGASAADGDGNDKKAGDDMFAEAKEAPGVAAGPVLGPAPAGQSQAPTDAKPSTVPLPQAFSAAKLMMPPVRRTAQSSSKRPMMPSLDLSKLQEEKEALMRQTRAAAERRDDKPVAATTPSGGASASVGGSGVEMTTVPATASTAPASSSTSGASATSLYGSPDEEYDPAKPNDYDEFCRRRMRLKAEEEMERRRQEIMARQQQASKPPEPKEDDFATKMLKKMGWKEGTGLGKDGQGMQAPLVMRKTDERAGTIVEGAKREPVQPAANQPAAKQAKAAPTFNRPPTRVLLLNNLVGKGEVDEDLEEETAEEAGKYGKLKRCVIKEIKELPDDQAVRIFLEFEKAESATKALVDMNGRYFGGRTVKARFYDEQRFEKGDLDKKDGLE